MEAATHFFAQARMVVGHAPETVTTDGRDAYPRAIRATLGPEVLCLPLSSTGPPPCWMTCV